MTCWYWKMREISTKNHLQAAPTKQLSWWLQLLFYWHLNFNIITMCKFNLHEIGFNMVPSAHKLVDYWVIHTLPKNIGSFHCISWWGERRWPDPDLTIQIPNKLFQVVTQRISTLTEKYHELYPLFCLYSCCHRSLVETVRPLSLVCMGIVGHFST